MDHLIFTILTIRNNKPMARMHDHKSSIHETCLWKIILIYELAMDTV